MSAILLSPPLTSKFYIALFQVSTSIFLTKYLIALVNHVIILVHTVRMMNIQQFAGTICAEGGNQICHSKYHGFLACLKWPSQKLAKIIKIKVFNIIDSFLFYIAAMYGYICHIGYWTL